MKTHTQTIRSSVRTPGRLGWLFLLPALALSLPAQTGPELSVTNTGGGSLALIWQEEPGEEYIVVWSHRANETRWYPCLEEIVRGSGLCQMAVQVPHQGKETSKYFRLRSAESWRFVEDFGDGDISDWIIAYEDPQAETNLTVEATDGHLRIHGDWPGTNDDRGVYLCKTNLLPSDFAMSIDIHGWDESPGDLLNVWLIARGNLAYFHDPDKDASVHGGVSMTPFGSTTNSLVWLMKIFDNLPTTLFNSDPFEKIVPTKDYRLEFYGTGAYHNVLLHEILPDGTLRLIHGFQGPEDPFPKIQGWVGLGAKEGGPSGTVDFTLDNVVIVGTVPSGP